MTKRVVGNSFVPAARRSPASAFWRGAAACSARGWIQAVAQPRARPRIPSRRPTTTGPSTAGPTASTSPSASAACAAWRPARPKTTWSATPTTSGPGWSAMSTWKARKKRGSTVTRTRRTSLRPVRRASIASTTATGTRRSTRRFSCPRSATTALQPPRLRAGLPGGRHVQDRGRGRAR